MKIKDDTKTPTKRGYMARKIRQQNFPDAQKSRFNLLFVILAFGLGCLVFVASWLAWWVCSIPFVYCSWLYS